MKEAYRELFASGDAATLQETLSAHPFRHAVVTLALTSLQVSGTGGDESVGPRGV